MGRFTVKRTFKPERLKTALKKAGRNQSWLASKVGKHKMTVYRWVSGQLVPREDSLRKIADALNTTPEYLQGITSIRERPAYIKWKTKQEEYERQREQADREPDEIEQAIAHQMDEDFEREKKVRAARENFFREEFQIAYRERERPDKKLPGIELFPESEEDEERGNYWGDAVPLYTHTLTQDGRNYCLTASEFNEMIKSIWEVVQAEMSRAERRNADLIASLREAGHTELAEHLQNLIEGRIE